MQLSGDSKVAAKKEKASLHLVNNRIIIIADSRKVLKSVLMPASLVRKPSSTPS